MCTIIFLEMVIIGIEDILMEEVGNEVPVPLKLFSSG
jgi:hypothetical protein